MPQFEEAKEEEKPAEEEEQPQEEEEKAGEQPEEEAPAEEEEQPAKEPKAKKKGKSIDERVAVIDSKTAEMRALERQIAENQAKLDADRKAFEESQMGALKEPNIDDYEDTEKYKKDIKAFYEQKSELESKQKTNENITKQRTFDKQQKILTNWNMKRQQAITKDPMFTGYDGVVKSAFRVNNTSPDVEEELIGSEIATDLVTYLAKNPEELQTMAQAGPGTALKELGKLEARLSASPKKTSPTAPKPPSGNPGGGGASKDLSKMSQTEYNEYMNKKMAGS